MSVRDGVRNPVPVVGHLIEGVDTQNGVSIALTHQDISYRPFWVDLERLQTHREFWYATDLDYPMRECKVVRGPKVFANGDVAVEFEQSGKIVMLRLVRVDSAEEWDFRSPRGVFGYKDSTNKREELQ